MSGMNPVGTRAEQCRNQVRRDDRVDHRANAGRAASLRDPTASGGEVPGEENLEADPGDERDEPCGARRTVPQSSRGTSRGPSYERRSCRFSS